ncbi:MAG: hypothetical protein C4319_03610 [Acidimicrobiia bacterium]
MARTVYYKPDGDVFRISPHSSSQIRQLLAAGRHDQIDAEEAEFFDDILEDLSRLLGKRIRQSARERDIGGGIRLQDSQEAWRVQLAPAGVIVVSQNDRSLWADKDGMVWLRQVFQGKLVFVLDAPRRNRQ